MGTRAVAITERYKAFDHKQRVRWSTKMREAFLDHLAATCNVRAAADFIGVEPKSVYLLRRRDAKFAAAWSEALVLGYEMLETQLVGHALAGEEGDALPNDAATALGPINVSLAKFLLEKHRNASGKPRRGGPVPVFAKREDTDKAILWKLDQIETRRAAAVAREAALRLARGEVVALPAPDRTDADVDEAEA